MVAGFVSEWVAGFKLECMAGFVGIRTHAHQPLDQARGERHGKVVIVVCLREPNLSILYVGIPIESQIFTAVASIMLHSSIQSDDG